MPYLECIDGKSEKFWSVEVSGKTLSLNWGKLGQNGQHKKKVFDNKKDATKHAVKLMAEKKKKGYVEATDARNKTRANPTGKKAVKKLTDAPAKPKEKLIQQKLKKGYDTSVRPKSKAKKIRKTNIIRKKVDSDAKKTNFSQESIEKEFISVLKTAIYDLKAEDIEALWEKQEISAVHIAFADPAKLLKRLAGRRPGRTVMMWEPRFKEGIIKASTHQPIEVFGNEHSRYWLRFDPYRATVGSIKKWADSKYSSERIRSAYHKDCPSEILEKLAVDKSTSVREAVIANENCTTDLQFATLNHPKMARLVQKIGYLTPEILTQLGNSEHEPVRVAALANTNHPEWQRTLTENLESNPWFSSLVSGLSEEAGKALGERDVTYFPGENRKASIRSNREIAKTLALLGDDQTSENVLIKNAHDKSRLVRYAVTRHPNVPLEIIQQLVSDKDALVSASAQSRLPTTAPQQSGDVNDEDAQSRKKEKSRKNTLAKYREKKDLIQKKYWGVAARNPVTGPEVLRWLAKCKDKDVDWELANNPSTPPDVLIRLAKSKDFGVQRCAIAHSAFPIDGFEQLMPKHLTAWMIGNSPSISLSLLQKLYQSDDAQVRSAVAKNSNTPDKILVVLATDSDNWVRASVAENPNTEVSLLSKLAKDNSQAVLDGLASNPSCPTSILKQLLNQGEWKLKGYLAGSGVSFKKNQLLRTLAQNSSCPASLLEKLSTCPDEGVRWYVAGNTACPSKLLKKLANDPNEIVRKEVARNTNTPAASLSKLANDKEVYIAGAAASNSSLPVEVLETLYKSKSVDVRQSVAGHAKTPPKILKNLAFDKNKIVRKLARENKALPRKLALQILSEEKDNSIKTMHTMAINLGKEKEIAKQLLRPSKMSTKSDDVQDILSVARSIGKEQKIATKLLESNKLGTKTSVAYFTENKLVLSSLAHDKNADVLDCILRNQNKITDKDICDIITTHYTRKMP